MLHSCMNFPFSSRFSKDKKSILEDKKKMNTMKIVSNTDVNLKSESIFGIYDTQNGRHKQNGFSW